MKWTYWIWSNGNNVGELTNVQSSINKKHQNYKYEKAQITSVLSGVLKKEITTGTKRLEKVFTPLTNVLHMAPKLPTDDYQEEWIPRIGIA